VIVSLLAMRLPRFVPKEHPPVWRHLADGFRYVAGNSPVRRLLAVMGAATLAGMPALVLMPFFADAIFHRGSSGYGILMSGMGIGAVIGPLVLARRTRARGLARVMVVSGLTTGVCYIAFALSPWYWLSLAIMPLIGYSVMRQMASANTTIQTLIPEEYRGRTMALYAMTVVGLGPFGSLAAGALAHQLDSLSGGAFAHQFGARAAMALGGLLALGASTVFAATLRRNPIVA